MNLAELTKNPANPRLIKDEKFARLKKSLKEFPQMMELRPIVIDESGLVLGGNMRLEALKANGLKEIPDEWVKRTFDLTPEQKQEFIIKDNNSFGEYDWDMLANEWGEYPLSEWGVDIPEDWATKPVEEDEAAVSEMVDRKEELQKKWKVRLGDLWQVGDHRLICGDCTDEKLAQRLMGADGATICFTSPPYNIGTNAVLSFTNAPTGDTKYTTSSDDVSSDDYLSLLNGFTTVALQHSQFVFVNIQQLANNKRVLIDWQYQFKDHFADVIIWSKGHGQPSMAENVLNCDFEFIFVLGAEDEPSRAIRTGNFRGTLSNVYSAPPQRDNEFADVHSATFPVHLPEYILNNFTAAGDSVYDAFGGTGTTMAVAHQLNRKSFICELEPLYCAVVLERMSLLGLSPKVTANG